MNKLWKGIAAVVGGFIIQLTLGTLYTFGNMSPYISSYLRYYLKVDARSADNTWIFAFSIFGLGSIMMLGGVLDKMIGPRLTCLLGGWIMSLGTAVTFFTIKHGLVLCVVTYGAIYGFGTGIAYAVSIASAVSWFPKRKGLISGIVVAGFGGGSLIFDQMQTKYINPNNWMPNLTITVNNVTEKFFDQPSLLDRVPTCFLILGAAYAVIQLVGSLLLSYPKANELEERAVLVHSEASEIEVKHGNIQAEDSIKEVSQVNGNEDVDMSFVVIVKRLVIRREFWILWGTFLFNFQAIEYISTQYKAFGETFIQSDQMLALAGSLAGIFNACGRVVWGQLIDYIDYKWLMMALTTLMAVFMLTLRLAQTLNSTVFFIVWLCLIFGISSGNFTLLPAVCISFFGQKNMTINYGLIFTSSAISSVIGAFTASLVMSIIGYMGIFALGAGFSLFSFVLTLGLPKTVSK